MNEAQFIVSNETALPGTEQTEPVADAVQPEAAAANEQSEAEKTAAAETVQPSVVTKASQVVNQWWAEHIHNSPVSRDTETYNHMARAKETLHEMLKEALTDGAI